VTGKPWKVPESALVVVYTAALEVLLLERADRPGYWQSVTGSRDPGEALADTAAREVREETGIEAASHRLMPWNLQNVYEIFAVWRHRYAPGVQFNTEHVFGLRLDGRVPVSTSPREHLGHAWLPWREAADRCFSPSNAEAILHLPRFAA
jgi:dATP pyrophosphohydrolase